MACCTSECHRELRTYWTFGFVEELGHLRYQLSITRNPLLAPKQNLKDAAQKNMALKIRGPISSLSVSLKLDILQYPGFQRHFRPFICCYIARFHCGLGLLEHDQLSVSLA
ncbi:hypothetical protein T01_48 [Trichinella spiralis]|uniref:Uncharacterized protein n=1 Tax=Trichinella spiralis TaxID=6334 RepID=A0A0V1AZQ2_TRISP|nr:hypothetical protein T01_48 [Trichinella spiralis]